LLKDYDKLWVFGDSYTTPTVCVAPEDSFWGLTASHCGIPTIINFSKTGNSFDSVAQILIGEQAQYNWGKDLFLIGIPPLERITVFDNYKDTEYCGQTIDTKTWQLASLQSQAHHGLIALSNYGEDKQLIIHSDRSWLETQTLRYIFLLTTWLDSKNANYMILNLSKSFDQNNMWGPSSFVLPHVMNHSRCIIFKDTYNGINLNVNQPADFDQYGWMGHHGPAGNKYFFEKSLLPTMQRNKLC
jgi:hypothetical protein